MTSCFFLILSTPTLPHPPLQTARSYWGKFKTIVVLSAVYCLGSALMSVTALSPVLDVVGLWCVLHTMNS
jgi:hypothetical protein